MILCVPYLQYFFSPSTKRSSWIYYSSNPPHPMPRRRGTGNGTEARSEVRERALAYEAALITIFKITHGPLEFPMASAFAHPTRKGLRGHSYKFHQQRCSTRRHQFAFTIRDVQFWTILPAEVVNASSVKSFITFMDAHLQYLFPEVPI